MEDQIIKALKDMRHRNEMLATQLVRIADNIRDEGAILEMLKFLYENRAELKLTDVERVN